MSIEFLDPSGRLPIAARAALSRAHALLLSADYHAAKEELAQLAASDAGSVRAFANLYLGDIFHFQWDLVASQPFYEEAVTGFRAEGMEAPALFAEMRLADILLDLEAVGRIASADREAGGSVRASVRLDEA